MNAFLSFILSPGFYGSVAALVGAGFTLFGHPLASADQLTLGTSIAGIGAGVAGIVGLLHHGVNTAKMSPIPVIKATLFIGVGFSAMLGLTGCANLKDPTTTIVSVEAAYGVALAAENTYLASGKADPAVVRQLSTARKTVAAVLDPLAAAAAQGQAPSSDQALAAQTALTAFQAVLSTYSINPSTGSN